MPDLQPSDYVAAFTWDRLMAVAKIFFDTRQWVAENAQWQRGDSRTGVGFRSWEHGKHGVTVAAATDHSDWLSVRDGGARFLFLLGGVPIRFYRGDSEGPVPENYGDPDVIEREQLTLGLTDNKGIPFSGYFRMIVHADANGFPLAVYLAGVGFDTNDIQMAWQIPSASAGGVRPIVVPQAPIPLPPLVVQTVAEAERAAREAVARDVREREERERAGRKTTDTKGA